MAQDPRALLQRADKASSGAGGGFSFFGGRGEKWENAADLYTQAANSFRLQKLNKEAGAAFEKAAEIQIGKLNEPSDAANTYQEAFKVYKKDSPADAVRVIDIAINHYTSSGNFRRAATQKQNQAEVYEIDLHDEKHALEAYETAASWFDSDGAEALANKLYLKVADIAALQGDYYKAIEHFDRVASSSINNNLMRWSVKDYFLKSGLCLLALNDPPAFSNGMEKFRELDPSFQQTREYQLLVDLAEAISRSEKDQFQDVLYQYDQFAKLDKWKTTILLKIKDFIEEHEEDFS